MFYSIQSNVRNDNVAYDNFPVEYLYRISISVKCNIFVICEFKARLYTVVKTKTNRIFKAFRDL